MARLAGEPDQDWHELLRGGLANQDPALLKRVPKADLHCHALLSAPLDVYSRLLGRSPTPPPSRFGSFPKFIEYIVRELMPAMTGLAAVRALVAGALDRMIDDGVIYAEMSFDAILPDFIGTSMEAVADVLQAEIERVRPRLQFRPEIGLSRGLPPDELLPRLERALATGVFRSIDLYDDENLGVVKDFVPLYRRAADHGLKLKAHAGELLGAQQVRETVELLGLDAVQHGVRAVEDPRVADLLIERGTVLNVCPTSNVSLGVFSDFGNHSARELARRGVRLTVNTDDFTLFGASNSEELLSLARIGFTPDEIEQVVETGLAEARAAAA